MTSYERLNNAGSHGDGAQDVSDWPFTSFNQLSGKLSRAVSSSSGGAKVGYYTPNRVPPAPPPAPPPPQLSLPQRGRHQMYGMLVDTPYEANLLDNEEEDIAL